MMAKRYLSSMYRLAIQFVQTSEIFALLVVAGATAVCSLPGRHFFSDEQWTVFYLLVIFFIASTKGMRAGVVGALFSFLAWDYFFNAPYNSLFIADPKDWIFFFGYLTIGVTVGIRTGMLRDRQIAAITSQRETALLSKLCTMLVSMTSTQQMVDILLREVG